MNEGCRNNIAMWNYIFDKFIVMFFDIVVVMLAACLIVSLLLNYRSIKNVENVVGSLKKTLEEHVGKDKE